MLKINNASSKYKNVRVEQFKYLGTTPTSQNSLNEEIKNRLKLGNACCHSVQNILSSSLILKNMNIKTYKSIILPIVLYRCENWSLMQRKEHTLRLLENRALRRMLGPRGKRKQGSGEYYVTWSFIICTTRKILFG
jgi:hypothetical protein